MEQFYQASGSKKYHLNYSCCKLHQGGNTHPYIRVINPRHSYPSISSGSICAHCRKVGYFPNDHPIAQVKQYV
jgi:hypothetical protein